MTYSIKVYSALFITISSFSQFSFAAPTPESQTLVINSSNKSSSRAPVSSEDQNYTFTADQLNEINRQAIREVDGHIAEFTPRAWNQLAADYFQNSESEDPDLAVALRAEAINDRIHQLLAQKFPNKILSDSKWAWNNVGGVYARIKILYCSMNEYIALFGSSLPQSGFSGEYSNMDVYDIMTTGEMKSFDAKSENSFPVIYRSGDISTLKVNETRYYNMSKYTYMIDYGRGKPSIVPSLWSGVIAPYFFINHDSNSLTTQLGDCGRSVLNILSQKLRLK